ncbi:DUF3141 domain-containing protein [Paucibacter sp. KCTC 42545]|uniref:DUF3141 domain-containing protein n=1 Tax=Paucibacter sp. KCTC 42545 TaxID=1768242 RepID=UPI0009EA6A55|nr:DUF3141 domain-containing protein [Paucibacter sp. KCTC 42545]
MRVNAERFRAAIEQTGKVGQVLQRRKQIADAKLLAQVAKAQRQLPVLQLASATAAAGGPWQGATPWGLWQEWGRYAVDSAQRSLLFLDTLRQRGNNYHAHEAAGRPPLLHFDYEMVMDAREFAPPLQPVNYALVRIVPPTGVYVDDARRPYVIIDPRAGHGPGIGGFKDDSQVGMALRAGHPVYFVIFFLDPQPGQTLPDVCAAEQAFVRKVRELHPDSPKPAILGNCQGGWAAMMMAAADPETAGPIVINGAPMSYWGGAWSEGEGDNPMRYSGGLLGGSWLSSLTADLGNGIFDGAHLVANFATLNPANALWDKYYNLYAKVDTEAGRFLEFERWWGGFFLMNKAEIEWIVQNLFVGNRLWTAPAGEGSQAFDLRDIRSPIILFASMGDNVTPPQQAFNWVADVYDSTDEIKAAGQVIVGLLHEDIGHLGIFVSGKVAKKEHAQIVSVMESIESLPPGLYAMRIDESRGSEGQPVYEVSFQERELEDLKAQLNRFERRDEKPFEAVAEVSQLNQLAYEKFAQPLVQALATETSAEALRRIHPMRLEQGVASDRNPLFAWLAPVAAAVRHARQAVAPDSPFKQAEQAASTLISAALDYARDLRDASSEAMFFQLYGVALPALRAEGSKAAPATLPQLPKQPRDLPVVREALAAIAEGGYPQALARAACLLSSKGEPLPLALVELKAQLVNDYRDLLPALSADEWHKIRGRQELICRYEPALALATLPQLLRAEADCARFLAVLRRLLADPRIGDGLASDAQREMVDRICALLPEPASAVSDVSDMIDISDAIESPVAAAARPVRQSAARSGVHSAPSTSRSNSSMTSQAGKRRKAST